jgi:hypothetical protein
MIDIMENEVIGPAIRKGIEQGKTQLLTQLLTTRFGPLPDPVVTRLHQASESELSSWADRVLTARTLDEVFG